MTVAGVLLPSSTIFYQDSDNSDNPLSKVIGQLDELVPGFVVCGSTKRQSRIEHDRINRCIQGSGSNRLQTLAKETLAKRAQTFVSSLDTTIGLLSPAPSKRDIYCTICEIIGQGSGYEGDAR